MPRNLKLFMFVSETELFWHLRFYNSLSFYLFVFWQTAFSFCVLLLLKTNTTLIQYMCFIKTTTFFFLFRNWSIVASFFCKNFNFCICLFTGKCLLFYSYFWCCWKSNISSISRCVISSTAQNNLCFMDRSTVAFRFAAHLRNLSAYSPANYLVF